MAMMMGRTSRPVYHCRVSRTLRWGLLLMTLGVVGAALLRPLVDATAFIIRAADVPGVGLGRGGRLRRRSLGGRLHRRRRRGRRQLRRPLPRERIDHQGLGGEVRRRIPAPRQRHRPVGGVVVELVALVEPPVLLRRPGAGDPLTESGWSGATTQNRATGMRRVLKRRPVDATAVSPDVVAYAWESLHEDIDRFLRWAGRDVGLWGRGAYR